MTAPHAPEQPSPLTMTELVLDPLDDALEERRDPLEVARRPGVLEHWQALKPHDRLTTLVVRAWDARTYPLPVSEADPEAARYAAVLHAIAGRESTPALSEHRIRTRVGLPAPMVGLGASLLLLAALRAAVTTHDRINCPQCGQLWPRRRGASGGG